MAGEPLLSALLREQSFCHRLPFDRSSPTRWRQRLGEEQLAALIHESLSVAHKTGALWGRVGADPVSGPWRRDREDRRAPSRASRSTPYGRSAREPSHRLPKSRSNRVLHGRLQIQRRTEVVGIFPNEDAIIRLVGTILVKQNDGWPPSAPAT